MNDIETFARIPAELFLKWLGKEKDEAYKYLAGATDPVAFHRAQGRVQLIQEMENLLAKSQNLR